MEDQRMHTLRLTLWRTVALATPAVVMAACQIVPQPAPPAPYLLPNSSGNAVSVAGVTTAPTPVPLGTTYTIKRDTLQQSITLGGKVMPARATELLFHGSGTVSVVNANVGQSVKAGDDLAELALDDTSLQSAREQATLAEVAYESEQAKLDDMRAGSNQDSIQQMQVTIERDQADIQKLQQASSGVDAANSKADRDLAAAKDEADHKVAVAQEAVQSANDALTAAQANVKQAQDDAQAALDQSQADAQAAAATATNAVKMAQREVDRATRALALAKQNPATAAATARLESAQLKVEQDKEVLTDAQSAQQSTATQSPTLEHTAQQIAQEVAAANGAEKTAERALQTDSLDLKHVQTDVTSAKATDADAVTVAAQALDDAKANLTVAQTAEQAAKQKADAMAQQKTVPTRTGQQSIASAQAAVKIAEAGVRTAQLNLEDAQSAQTAAANATNTPSQFDDHSLTAAQLQLKADQAKLATLQAGAPAAELTREQTRVSILRDQANAAALAAQPTVTLTAPFDGSIGSVSLTVGQTLTGSTQTDSNGQPVGAIQLIASGADSILANATESEVAQLNKGASVSVSFPGLPGQTTSGTISDIGATASVANNQVTYPVHIDVPATPTGVKFGMTAQASVTTDEAKNVLVAPSRAIRTVNGQTLMSKIGSDGQVQDTPVQVGRTYGTSVEVLGGVGEGDVVAIFDGTTPREVTAAAAAP
ncbi:MAG: HlyD family efflux transporter periplasmic adaptor subunit [Chloroflexi bacterium]|nr:HlyD family efflux transporter periplasmic adaptor subunit [Chloroflexota bacterium]